MHWRRTRGGRLDVFAKAYIRTESTLTRPLALSSVAAGSHGDTNIEG
jgi:hypothetical protein